MRLQRTAIAALLIFVGGCSAFRQANDPPPAFFSLASPASATASIATRAHVVGATLIVNPPEAVAGFDSQRIIYVRQAHELEYFAHNQWIDTPARMLSPLIVAAIERGGAFRAVVHAPSTATGDLRLDTEIIRLQHEFLQHPSRVHFTLRATLVDSASRRVLATHEFDAFVTAATEDPYGGVLAADQAVANVLEELATFCANVKLVR